VEEDDRDFLTQPRDVIRRVLCFGNAFDQDLVRDRVHEAIARGVDDLHMPLLGSSPPLRAFEAHDFSDAEVAVRRGTELKHGLDLPVDEEILEQRDPPRFFQGDVANSLRIDVASAVGKSAGTG
jgi:hypothetical protein